MLKYIMAASIHFAQITKKQDLLPNKQQQCYGIQLSSISKNAGPSGTVLQAMRPRRIATEQDNGSSALTFCQFLLLGSSQALEFSSLCKCGRPTADIEAKT
jgi:hypothetical protein